MHNTAINVLHIDSMHPLPSCVFDIVISCALLLISAILPRPGVFVNPPPQLSTPPAYSELLPVYLGVLDKSPLPLLRFPTGMGERATYSIIDMSNHTRNHTRKPHPLDSFLGRGNYKLIAQSTGYTRQHISRVLRGMSGVSPICAEMICSAVGVTMDELTDYIESRCTHRVKPAVSKTRNRNRDIVALAQTHNVEEIADQFGMSRQQVSQILRYNAAEL